MPDNSKPSIQIDLNEFKLHLHLKKKTQLTLHFNTPSRRFYLSVIALVVNEMKESGKIKSIPLQEHLDLLALLNESIGGAAGSSEREVLLHRIYAKWKNALPNLEEAPLFKVLGRTKETGERVSGRAYSFTDEEKDGWANLFEYRGSNENVRLRFAIDKIGVGLDDVVIIFENSLNGNAWRGFIASLRGNVKGRPESLLKSQSANPPVDLSSEPGDPIKPPGAGGGAQHFLNSLDSGFNGIDNEPGLTVSKAAKTETGDTHPSTQISSPKVKGFIWQSQLRGITFVAALVVIAAVATLAVWKVHLRHDPPKMASLEKMAFPLPDKPSIAVLPLVNMNKDPEQELFCDGLTEEIITTLSKSPHLFVIARTSTFAYKGKSIRIDQVAEELGVRYVLEGSVRRSGEEIRISAQLIDATTSHHLWAERYDGKLRDVFALQDQISEKIAAVLAVKLAAGENGKTARRGTENVAAYEEFLKGWGYYLRFTSDDLAKAIQSFKGAIALDPNYAQAYAALALTYWSGSNIGVVSKGLGVPYIEARLVARKYLKEGLENPTSIVYLINSQYYLYRRQHEEAVSELQRALVLDPNNPSCNALMGSALFLSGKPREAVDFVNRAMRLDPHNPGRYLYLLGGAEFCIGNLEEAATLVEKGIKLNPELTGMAAWLAAAHGLLSHEKEARAALDIYNKISPSGPRKIRNIMYYFPFKDRAVADRFAEGLAKAGAPGKSLGYFRAYKENQLSGKEIESLLFGSTTTGPNRLDMDDGQYWLVDRKKNGDSSYRGPEPIPFDTGKSRIEGDTVCQQYQKSWQGLEYCSTVFKNPGGTYNGKDEYLFCRDFGFMPFSVVR